MKSVIRKSKTDCNIGMEFTTIPLIPKIPVDRCSIVENGEKYNWLKIPMNFEKSRMLIRIRHRDSCKMPLTAVIT